jgi:hypothetical protein
VAKSEVVMVTRCCVGARHFPWDLHRISLGICGLRGEGAGGQRLQLACEIIDFGPWTRAVEVTVDAVPAAAIEYVIRSIVCNTVYCWVQMRDKGFKRQHWRGRSSRAAAALCPRVELLIDVSPG